MARISILVLALFLAAGLGTCKADDKIPATAKTALEAADFELLSISPERPEKQPKEDFHGWKVLGRTTIKDATARMKLTDALKKGAEENDGDVADCFNPRHGIHTTVKGKSIDLLICFECSQVEVYVDGARDSHFLTSASPQAAFNEALRKSGAPLAEPAGP